MSDYFAHLAAAARRTVGEVRPRVPLPFEPPPFASTAEPDAPFAAEFVEEAAWEERPETPTPAEGPMLRPPETPSPPVVASMPRVATATPPIPESAPALPVAPPAVAAPRALPATPAATAPHPSTPSPEPVLMIGGVRPEPAAEPRGTEAPGPRSRDEPPLPRPSTPSTIRLADAPRREPVALARTTVLSPTEASPGARTAPAPPVLPPIPPRRERIRDAASTPAAAPSRETTIQVSIGRIEVRAAAAPPARERAAPVSPVMSLDDYLRARAGLVRSRR